MIGQASSNKKKVMFVLGVVVIAGILFLAVYFVRNMNRVTTDDAYIEGRIHSIAPKVSGTVREVYVNDNQAVKKGELLVVIDPADYEARVNEAEAALDAERSRLLDAETGIKASEVSLNQAALDKGRAEALFKENVIPKEKHEKAVTAYDLAAAALKASLERRELEQALVKQREAVLQASRLNLSYTKIAAPTDGSVTKKAVETGNQVQAGQPLMAIVALDDIWITANFKETQLENVRPGQRVLIKIDTYPHTVFTGKVDSIMAGTGAVFSIFPPENALGNYVKVVQRVPVKIVFDKGADAGQALRIGMSCIPTIITKK